MTRAPIGTKARLAGLATGVALVLVGCSSSGGGGSGGGGGQPAFSLPELKALLVNARDVPLSGITSRVAPGDSKSQVTSAFVYFTRTSDATDISVNLIAAASPALAKLAMTSALSFATQDLNHPKRQSVPIGVGGVELGGVSTITGQPSAEVSFLEGSVAVTVALDGKPSASLPAGLLTTIARRQDVKIKNAH